jgi:hypothetical protein
MEEHDDDDVLETKPSILSLLNRLYEQPSMDVSSDRQDSASPDEQVVQRLGALPSDVRTTLEDRFIELVQQYPCFYDPNDKNFVHNQVSC